MWNRRKAVGMKINLLMVRSRQTLFAVLTY